MTHSAKKTSLALAVGTVLGVSLGPVASAGDNPFALKDLAGGYMVAAAEESKGAEGKCGEGVCGGAMKEAAPADADAGTDKTENQPAVVEKTEDMPAAEKGAEGKCGEGMCGGAMKEAATAGAEKTENPPADVEKTEDAATPAEEKGAEGKCGEGKCGGTQ